jgi:ElaA protein
LIRSARFKELSTAQLYSILRLRSEVFVVEQNCVYLDLDGRDTHPTTTHFWIEEPAGAVVAAVRLLRSKPGSEIGRVVTDAGHRHRGLASELMSHALRVAPRPTRLNAQSYLEDWYARLGFERDGDEFLEDGIPHVPMVKTR